jgi:hypothetical protein
MSIAKLTVVFLVIISSTFADEVSDINSGVQVRLIWNYFQLRPPDVFTTTNTSTSLSNLAATYYGNLELASIIKAANPGIQDIITTKGKQITLPSILKCVEQNTLSCILTSHMVRGSGIPGITVEPQPMNLTHAVNKGRLLAGIGSEYDLALEEGHYLVEQFPDLKPTLLNLQITNQMGTWVNLKSTGAAQNVQPGAAYTHRENLIPPRSASRVISFTTFEGQEYEITITIKMNPSATFPFFYPAQQNTITALITGPNQYSRQLPEIFSTDGFKSFLINSPVNLNLTLSIDNDFQTCSANIILGEYYSKVLTDLTNRITNIFPTLNTNIALQTLNEMRKGFKIFTNSIDPNNRGASYAWRFSPHGRDRSFYRIINLATSEAMTANPNTLNIVSQAPKLQDLYQVWTLVPATNVNNVGAEFTQVFIRNQNLCWSLDQNEPSPIPAGNTKYPLRLRVCNPSDYTQIFSFYYPSSGKLNWNG